MRFLVDAQLPPALARWLSKKGHSADHVFDLGFTSASDEIIWKHAKKNKAVIISKDEDFVTLSTIDSNGPPVVWVRVGNTTNPALLNWFEPLFPRIEHGLQSGEKLIEII